MRDPGARHRRGDSLPAPVELHCPDFVHVLVDGRIVRSGGPDWLWSWREGYGAMEAESGSATLPKEDEGKKNVITATQQWKITLKASASSRSLPPAMTCHGAEAAPGRVCPLLRVGFHDSRRRLAVHNVSAIAQTPFQLAPNGRAWLSQQELEPYRVAGVACQLVFVNGRFARELSLLGKLPIR